jgi:hypothetical protein
VLHDARGGVLVLDDLSEVAAPSDRDAGGVSATGKELIEVPTPCPHRCAAHGQRLAGQSECVCVPGHRRACPAAASIVASPPPPSCSNWATPQLFTGKGLHCVLEPTPALACVCGAGEYRTRSRSCVNIRTIRALNTYRSGMRVAG